MLTKDEIVRRATRYMQTPAAERPIPHYTIARVAGMESTNPLKDVVRHGGVGDVIQRRLSKAFELLEGDQLPDPSELHGVNKYRRYKVRNKPQPPCQPCMVLDVTSGRPTLRTEFVNPNAFPEVMYTKVRK
jgi:hypothetical protein